MTAAKQRLQFITLDVFTEERYTGNQLAIIQVPASVTLTQEQKQKIAREFNYSESVILHDAYTEALHTKNERDIGIFLTDAEIPFAGHPTIGTSCFIGSEDTGEAEGVTRGTLNAKAGPVPFTYSHATNSASVSIPHDSHVHSAIFTPQDLARHGFPQEVVDAAPEKSPFVSIVKGVTFCLVQLPSLEVLARLSPTVRIPVADDMLDEAWSPRGAGLVAYMFYVQQGEEDGAMLLRTRMIMASLEDPATGAASGALAVYLALHDPGREKSRQGTRKFHMVQGVEMGRRSVIGVEVEGDQGTSLVQSVTLKGSAVEVMRGSLIVPD